MTDTTKTVNEWVAEARELGREHARGEAGGATDPMEIINLQTIADEMGAGISWGELIEIQNALTDAYEEGLQGADA